MQELAQHYQTKLNVLKFSVIVRNKIDYYQIFNQVYSIVILRNKIKRKNLDSLIF
jgi:hypothetical protein